METKHLTIIFTDMKGFTSRTAVHTREQLEKLLDLQDELVRPIFKEFKGKIVKTIGDAFMVVFTSPTDAVLCGIKIQDELIKYNEKAEEEEKMEIRIGINSGEVNIKGDDYFGEPVNIASRIESIAESNEVYFTESVYLSMNKNEIPSVEIGIRHLKGIPDDIKVYKVLREEDQIERIKNERKRMAISANAFSKSGESKKKVENQENNSVKIARMILYFTGGFIGFIFLIVIIMWIFKICPPKGPWATPPWCKEEKNLINSNKETSENGIRAEIERIIADTEKAIMQGDQRQAKKNLEELKRINEKLGGDPRLQLAAEKLKGLFEEKFLKGR